ncbi:prolyl 4-hydroxylase subunit alpha-3-like [Mytilus californianus]|uniref:prolyl 4-hydroxylase subunit alpha-3-like n=1 Tax=Mytilus californianus TaxID=6549 RepID=UPI002246BB41|nr:prolyl 4-hydroxylase subunit alpha-3-like [Mytilus californianus]
MRFYILILYFGYQAVYSELFTTYVNFERYFQMEEELIVLTDLVIQQERIIHGEDVHNFNNITHTIDEAKSIHMQHVDDIETYLSHPINTFRLSRRLAQNWKQIIGQMMETDTCVKALRVKLQNMEDNIPDDQQLTEIANSVLNLEQFHNITIGELLVGEINGHLPHEPFTLGDLVYIAKAAYDTEQYYYTITWLRHVIDEIKLRRIDDVDGEYAKAAVYSLLASAYFKIGHIRPAAELTDEILSFDPDNVKAQRNKIYFDTVEQTNPKSITKPKPSEKVKRLFNKICNQDVKQKISKEKCLYFPLRNKMWYMRSDIKAEVLKNKPLIIYFHDLIDNKTANALRYMGYETLMNSTSRYRYSYPRQSSIVYDNTNWGWVQKLKEKFYSMDISNKLVTKSKFNVMNIGLEGSIRKPQKNIYPYPLGSLVVGSFIVSLSERTLGGDLVFPLANTKVSINKGDGLFYEETTLLTMCPVAYGSQWYGFQYLYQVPYSHKICPPKRHVRKGY